MEIRNKNRDKNFYVVVAIDVNYVGFYLFTYFFSGRRNEFIFKAMMTFLCQESRFL